MTDKERFSIAKRIKSFRYAFNGIRYLFRFEHNARIHLVLAICAIVAGILLHISSLEWIAVLFAIGSVLAAEAVNSAVEALADLVSPQYNELIKRCKDLAAGGVLIMAITALLIGLIIFLPKLIFLFY
ncbi:MAG: diacylglycerol kinase family protein [Bacteroidales bacterium]|nr:diacylglycerol kinase family protein [Bacteroidales bacterium]